MSTYEVLENAIDRCKDVAETLERVIVKNKQPRGSLTNRRGIRTRNRRHGFEGHEIAGVSDIRCPELLLTSFSRDVTRLSSVRSVELPNYLSGGLIDGSVGPCPS
jgi:hypothetical protein